MWKEKEQAARAFANAVVKSGLRGWVESDIVGKFEQSLMWIWVGSGWDAAYDRTYK